MTNFHVGQKVTLVDDSRRKSGVPREKGLSLGAEYPVKGVVYTIRSIYLTTPSGTSAILLEEIHNAAVGTALGMCREPGFDADRFRPVVERKTSIKIFTDMLKTQRTGVRA